MSGVAASATARERPPVVDARPARRGVETILSYRPAARTRVLVLVIVGLVVLDIDSHCADIVTPDPLQEAGRRLIRGPG